jgi:hypothetical protein
MMTEAQVLGAEMERVDPLLPTLFDRDSGFYSQIEKAPAEVVSARDMRIPLELRPGGYFGHFDPDGGDLGVGDGPTYDKAVINVAFLKHAIQWTKKAEWATDDKRKAVLNTFRTLLSKSMAEFRRNADSLCMTGGTGQLGTISAVSINSPTGYDTITLGTDGFGARLTRFGQKVHISTPSWTHKTYAGGPKQIAFHDLVNKQIRVATGITPAAADVLLVDGVVSSASNTPVSLLGVPYHHSNASTGTWLGFDRSLTPEIRANRVTASSALTLPFPRRAMNMIGDRCGIDNTYKAEAWMHPCQKQAYEELGQLVSVINKGAKEEGIDLYFNDNMQMAGAPVKTSFSWDKTRIDFIVKEVWKRAEMKPAGFYDVDGRRIFEIRGTSGGVATSQVFYLVTAFNLYVTNPAACAYIDTLTVPSGY